MSISSPNGMPNIDLNADELQARDDVDDPVLVHQVFAIAATIKAIQRDLADLSNEIDRRIAAISKRLGSGKV